MSANVVQSPQPQFNGPCSVCSRCLISDLPASTVASVISLGIAILAVCRSFPRDNLRLPSLFIGAAYLLAVLYFYIGALDIEHQLSALFHNTPGFWVRREFVLRCGIVTVLVVSISLAGTRPPTPERPYSTLAIGLLVVVQLVYLLWDVLVLVLGKSNGQIKEIVRRRFLLGDVLGLIAAILIFLMTIASPEVLTSGQPPRQVTRLPEWAPLLGGFGTLLYLIAVSGPVWGTWFTGGIWRFGYEAVYKVIKRETR